MSTHSTKEVNLKLDSQVNQLIVVIHKYLKFLMKQLIHLYQIENSAMNLNIMKLYTQHIYNMEGALDSSALMLEVDMKQ